MSEQDPETKTQSGEKPKRRGSPPTHRLLITDTQTGQRAMAGIGWQFSRGRLDFVLGPCIELRASNPVCLSLLPMGHERDPIEPNPGDLPPTHEIRAMHRPTDRWSYVGLGWQHGDGRISLRLYPCVVLVWHPDLMLSCLPRQREDIPSSPTPWRFPAPSGS